MTVGPDGKTLHYLDRRHGVDYCRQPSPFAHITKNGVRYASTRAALADGQLRLTFGDSGVTVSLRVSAKRQYFVVEVVSVEDY